MFQPLESIKQDAVSKEDFDKANQILLASNRREIEGVDYMVFEVALGTAHTNEAIGLMANGIIADSFTVLSAPNTATIRINSPSANAITAIQGWRRQGVIRELYVTNSVAGGTLQVEVTWRAREKLKMDEIAELDVAQKREKAIALIPSIVKATPSEPTNPWVIGGLALATAGVLVMVTKSGRK